MTCPSFPATSRHSACAFLSSSSLRATMHTLAPLAAYCRASTRPTQTMLQGSRHALLHGGCFSFAGIRRSETAWRGAGQREGLRVLRLSLARTLPAYRLQIYTSFSRSLKCMLVIFLGSSTHCKPSASRFCCQYRNIAEFESWALYTAFRR